MGIPKLYRVIEVSGDCSFDDLHESIFEAFHRYDYHLYSFFITRKNSQNIRQIYDAPEITHPQNMEDIMGLGRTRRSAAKTRIADIGFDRNDVFHYLFDFGDDWWHRIRVQAVNETKSNRKHIKLIKPVGESPLQYPDFDEYDDEDE